MDWLDDEIETLTTDRRISRVTQETFDDTPASPCDDCNVIIRRAAMIGVIAGAAFGIGAAVLILRSNA